jgi:predicted enzyme related to lactoylglutathione lyase
MVRSPIFSYPRRTSRRQRPSTRRCSAGASSLNTRRASTLQGVSCGALHTDVAVAPTGGPVLWLFVNDIQDSLRRIGDLGGRVLQGVESEGPWLQASVADPAGNVVGVWQNTPS